MVERNVSLVKFIVDCCNLDQFAGRPTRVRKMTDRGREFTVHLQRKAALKGKEEFRLQLVSFEKSIYDKLATLMLYGANYKSLKALQTMQYKDLSTG